LSDAGVPIAAATGARSAGAELGALAINADGSATSPPLCIDAAMPTLRLFARETSGTSATMTVALLWSDTFGIRHTTTVATIARADDSWAPTNVLALATAVPLTQPGGTQEVQVELLPRAAGGNWAITDIYADPYSKGYVVDATDPITGVDLSSLDADSTSSS
jgi:hypothetical protein